MEIAVSDDQIAITDHQLEAARRPETTASVKHTPPMTGSEFIESLRDGREVFIYGERVKDVTVHPAFRNTARMIARLYDALHDPQRKDRILTPTDTGNGGVTHAYFKAPKTLADCCRGVRRSRNGAADLTGGSAVHLITRLIPRNGSARTPTSMRRTRRTRGAGTATARNASPFVNHASFIPPSIAIVRRTKSPERLRPCREETDAGIIVSGAKVVATGSVLTNFTFVAHHGLIPFRTSTSPCVFIVPTSLPGVKFPLPRVVRDVGHGDGQPLRLSPVVAAR
jgi:4-hydroxyphenylacetate 3-monooxygenase